ncbi:ABC transporter substrate-binding protein [Schaalia odontolytica]|uniref:D-allose-binding periplasmic protein n=1 Tax=Schaalia odontolytica TaxID=1660 RepID=A0A2X0U2N4_9ACTO|nr:ABC transporter substrate-binding protein [Schaalia odontolytica]WMS27988.1 ABC transporter substrate-binding protein [Schaalia odontolytica]SPT56364.1 D-allose-binding periplasmic protein precursor [Schaalia odontolytica]
MRPIGRIFAAAAVGSMALGLAACTTSTDSSASSDSKPSESSGSAKVDTSGDMQDWEKAAVKGDGTKTIYLVSKGFQHRFWQAVKEGAEQAGDELGYKVNFVGPQDETKVTEQTDQLKSALDSGPAAIGFAALDSKAAADLLSEIDGKGIPVVAFDSGVESDIPVTTVQTDNKAAAAEAAKHMIELLKGKKGSVGMVCHDSTSTTGKQRCEGFKEYFKANAPADLKLLDEQIAGEVTKAADTSLSIIQANSDIVGMYGSNEAAASGIVQGVAESGKELSVVGFDSGKTQIDAIKAGTEAGAVTQSPVKIGYYTVKAAVAALNGAELPEVIDSGFAWYDKTNIDNADIKANLYE